MDDADFSAFAAQYDRLVCPRRAIASTPLLPLHLADDLAVDHGPHAVRRCTRTVPSSIATSPSFPASRLPTRLSPPMIFAASIGDARRHVSNFRPFAASRPRTAPRASWAHSSYCRFLDGEQHPPPFQRGGCLEAQVLRLANRAIHRRVRDHGHACGLELIRNEVRLRRHVQNQLEPEFLLHAERISMSCEWFTVTVSGSFPSSTSASISSRRLRSAVSPFPLPRLPLLRPLSHPTDWALRCPRRRPLQRLAAYSFA